MEVLIKKINELKDKVLKLGELLNIEKKKLKMSQLESLLNSEGFWQKDKNAVSISQELESLRSEVHNFEDLSSGVEDLSNLLNLSKQLKDESVLEEVEKDYCILSDKFKELEFLLLFSEENDNKSAIISIHAGTGGVDAQDWAEMLERMYFRFAEKKGFKLELLDRVVANEAGIKNSTFKVSGAYAYGYLKSENGVHRLVRISPFDAENMRHTSFAGVEVVPEVGDDKLVKIEEKDLRIDSYKSSGPGGQSVNTTDSAIRIVHVPSNISVSCQSERSQHQNKEKALIILKAKLYKKQEDENDKKNKDIKGDAGQGTWGKQIRSYVFQPYQMVKDHRSNFSSSDVGSVMDGEISSFMESFLSLKLGNKNK